MASHNSGEDVVKITISQGSGRPTSREERDGGAAAKEGENKSPMDVENKPKEDKSTVGNNNGGQQMRPHPNFSPIRSAAKSVVGQTYRLETTDLLDENQNTEGRSIVGGGGELTLSAKGGATATTTDGRSPTTQDDTTADDTNPSTQPASVTIEKATDDRKPASAEQQTASAMEAEGGTEPKQHKKMYTGLVSDAGVTRTGTADHEGYMEAAHSAREQERKTDDGNTAADDTAADKEKVTDKPESSGGGDVIIEGKVAATLPSFGIGGGGGATVSAAGSADGGEISEVAPCGCDNCYPGGCSSCLQTLALWLSIPLIFYYYFFMYRCTHSEPQDKKHLKQLAIAAGVLVAMLVAQVLLTFTTHVFDEDEWEENARMYGFVLLVMGILFGFLLGMCIVRFVLLRKLCASCGKS